MIQNTSTSFLLHGITTTLAEKAKEAGLTVSKARVLSQREMVSKYGLSDIEAKTLATAALREPIDKNLAHTLLENTNFVFCICK